MKKLTLLTLIVLAACGGSDSKSSGGGGPNGDGNQALLSPLAVGYSHSCVVENGTVKCWGANSSQQLGSKKGVNYSTPLKVDITGTVKSVVVGDGNSCAIIDDGTVQCWGENWAGQIGDGTSSEVSGPSEVMNLSGKVKQLIIENRSICALINDGTVQCWGYNYFGLAGRNPDDVTDVTIPNNIEGFSGAVKSLSDGNNSLCALIEDGTVQCWGYNGEKQLGSNANTTRSNGIPYSSTPLTISGLNNVIKLDGSCALTEVGEVFCWGDNSSHQLANASLTESATPIKIALSGKATDVVYSYITPCALIEDGTVQCWGDNHYGQVGDGTAGNFVDTPSFVSGLSGKVKNLAMGVYGRCAVIEDGTVQCWGNNRSGQLGNGTNQDTTTAVTVMGLLGKAKYIKVGGYAFSQFFCALLEDNTVNCWGYNQYGNLGNGLATNSSVPVEVGSFPSSCSAESMGTYYYDLDQDGFGRENSTTIKTCTATTTDYPLVINGNDFCDDDATTISTSSLYYDGDRDGFGAGTLLDACPYDWYVANNTDCDDIDATIGEASWYPDADGDTYGDDSATPVCEADKVSTTTYVEDNTDCDDGSDKTNPSKTDGCPSVNGNYFHNRIDNNCDGTVDNGPNCN